MKQGEENTEFVKEPENETPKFIFQKNRKTIIGAVVIVAFLIFIILAIVVSGVSFN
jgi:preprotein translocase subunit SecE